MINNRHKCTLLFGSIICSLLSCNIVEGMQNGIMTPISQKIVEKTETTAPQSLQAQSLPTQMLPYLNTTQVLPTQLQNMMLTLPILQQSSVEQQSVAMQHLIPGAQQYVGQIQSGQSQPIVQKQGGMNEQRTSAKRTCLEAFQLSVSSGIYENYCILDLSNTTDFTQNADLITSQLFIQMQSAGIKCIYMDLYNSSVNDTYISKWVTQFRQAGIRVLWNLSGNKTVTDQTITMLGSLENVIGLNLAGTSITDTGINQIVNMLNGNPVEIDFINIYKCNISDTSRAMLEYKFNDNINKWNTMYPNKKSSRRGIIKRVGLSLDKRIDSSDLNTTQVTSNISDSNVGLSVPATVGTSALNNTLTVGNINVENVRPTTQDTKNSQSLVQDLSYLTNPSIQSHIDNVRNTTTIPLTSAKQTPLSAQTNSVQLNTDRTNVSNISTQNSVLPQTM